MKEFRRYTATTTKPGKVLLCVYILLILLCLFFLLTPIPSYAGEKTWLPNFGKGNVKVRLYTDYFCSPCQDLEPKIEPILAELVKKNIATVTFIDTPFHQHSTMYATYFLYAIYEKDDYVSAIKARSVLRSSAIKNIRDKSVLEETLRNNDVPIKQFDIKPLFAMFTSLMRDDRISATPICAIERNGSKETFTGGPKILKALEELISSKR